MATWKTRPGIEHKDQFERVERACLALPDAIYKEAWGNPTFRVRDKMFASFMDNHHGDGRVAMWCNAPRGAQEVLVGSEPERYFKPPYLGPRGWIGLILSEHSDEELTKFARQAYCVVAGKKRIALLEDAE